MKVIIDTNPGTDDALAIMMALNSAEMKVLGLTTVGGNASLTHTTRNALSLLEHRGRPKFPCRGEGRVRCAALSDTAITSTGRAALRCGSPRLQRNR